ncbi:hypothetical protein GCM10023149_21170 [Mucilaginibacter gynuensis]|uniref:Uncharacterized protein n=1 Tax=Mucilaginibacter gynuensis TaxID=1302236 RepID=A0ABP8GBR0_9SPHI
MKFFDENNQPLDIDQLKKELRDLKDEPIPTESDLESDLEAAYQQGNTNVTGMAAISFLGIGGNLLKKIRRAVCAVVGPGSSADEIIDAILDELVKLIPGGFILKPLVKKIAKFIFDKGIGAFCAGV